jgi:hypothetical protein
VNLKVHETLITYMYICKSSSVPCHEDGYIENKQGSRRFRKETDVQRVEVGISEQNRIETNRASELAPRQMCTVKQVRNDNEKLRDSPKNKKSCIL